MKLYVRPIAPNAIKVLVFLGERGIALETVDVSDLAPEDYRRINPLLANPVLETDSGLFLSESLVICRYLDEIADGPTLFGAGAEARAIIGMWERRAELMLMNPAIEYGHHSHAFFADRLRQFPDWAREHVAATAPRMIAAMEARLAESPFLGGDALSIADITAFLGYFGLLAYAAIMPSTNPDLLRWQSAMSLRPSMKALYALAAQFDLRAV